ncbi:MAG TPA: hypothetical protein VGG74_00145 [Kofleriaceae bacterium]|jgi:hypothetical protein
MTKRFVVATAFALIAQTACGEMTSCPDGGCPATYIGVRLLVQGGGAAALTAASVAISGPQTGTMSCAPNQSDMLCIWPAELPVIAGTYSLAITAPGYAPMTISAAVAIDPVPECGCTLATLTPSDVTLEPM